MCVPGSISSGAPSPRRLHVEKEGPIPRLRRRKEMILALVDKRADRLDRAADDLGKFFDHLRQVGIRGFLAENTGDSDYAEPPEARRPPS